MGTSTTDRPFESLMMLRLCGEVTTKSRGIRQAFNRRLIRNIQDALERAGIDAKVRDKWFRVDVATEDRRAVEVAQRIFGIQAISWTQSYQWETIDDVVAIGEELFADKVAGKTFAVRTRRAGFRQEIPFTSMDVDRALGSKLVEAGGAVDLDDHQVRVGVEVRRDRAFFYDEEVLGVAGLPNGVEGRALALMSGGFDSAVAAWSMMRRGVDMDFLFFNLAGPPQERAVQEVTRALCERWAFGFAPRMHIVDFRPMIAEMRQKVDGHYWQILLKRLMVRVGHEIAQNKGYPALITGDSCGQVSSQTLRNMAAISAPITTAVLRPLVGRNKEEIIELSRLVGTHDISSQVPEFCSLDGGPPAVDATAEDLDEVEEKLDKELLKELIRHRKYMTVLEMDLQEEMDTQIGKVPKGAMVIDLRREREFKNWSYRDSVNIPLERAIEQAGLLPKEAIYLLYCEVGLKSAFLAEAMRDMGFDAFSFSGGVPKLRKYAQRGEVS